MTKYKIFYLRGRWRSGHQTATDRRRKAVIVKEGGKSPQRISVYRSSSIPLLFHIKYRFPCDVFTSCFFFKSFSFYLKPGEKLGNLQLCLDVSPVFTFPAKFHFYPYIPFS